MKLFRGLALISTLALSTTAAFANSVQISSPAPSAGDNVCVDVYCNGSFGGKACGKTTQDLVDGAIELCSSPNQS
jgi:hypothetical protein